MIGEQPVGRAVHHNQRLHDGGLAKRVDRIIEQRLQDRIVLELSGDIRARARASCDTSRARNPASDRNIEMLATREHLEAEVKRLEERLAEDTVMVFKIPLPRAIANGLGTQAVIDGTSVREVLRDVIMRAFKPPQIEVNAA